MQITHLYSNFNQKILSHFYYYFIIITTQKKLLSFVSRTIPRLEQVRKYYTFVLRLYIYIYSSSPGGKQFDRYAREQRNMYNNAGARCQKFVLQRDITAISNASLNSTIMYLHVLCIPLWILIPAPPPIRPRFVVLEQSPSSPPPTNSKHRCKILRKRTNSNPAFQAVAYVGSSSIRKEKWWSIQFRNWPIVEFIRSTLFLGEFLR